MHNHAHLQDLKYTYDPIGNITSIADHAQQTVYFDNQVVSPSNDYIYDAIYRLISAEGREHAGKPGQPQTTDDDVPRMNYPLPSDGHALHRYREQYEYDAVGNIRPADLIYLSFSFDHRVVDGAVGAAFSNVVIRFLQNPAALLLPDQLK